MSDTELIVLTSSVRADSHSRYLYVNSTGINCQRLLNSAVCPLGMVGDNAFLNADLRRI
jgi:hypothetical protein